jgi:hypothetical protein
MAIARLLLLGFLVGVCLASQVDPAEKSTAYEAVITTQKPHLVVGHGCRRDEDAAGGIAFSSGLYSMMDAFCTFKTPTTTDCPDGKPCVLELLLPGVSWSDDARVATRLRRDQSIDVSILRSWPAA